MQGEGQKQSTIVQSKFQCRTYYISPYYWAAFTLQGDYRHQAWAHKWKQKSPADDWNYSACPDCICDMVISTSPRDTRYPDLKQLLNGEKIGTANLRVGAVSIDGEKFQEITPSDQFSSRNVYGNSFRILL